MISARGTRLTTVVGVVALLLSSAVESARALSFAAGGKGRKKYGGGAGVGRLVVDEGAAAREGAWRCHYDMVLCERIQGRPPTDSGLYVPREDLPRLHLCRVLAVGPGREEESGLVAPMPDVKVGDVVIAKNPWGIGPKDEETTSGKKLSFMRSQDIAAIVTGGLAEEKEK
jgi:co-chaperonin GroES (HSP10)